MTIFPKTILRKVIQEQWQICQSRPLGLPRDALQIIEAKVRAPHIIVITGIRRAGKSTLLRQIMRTYYNPDEYYFISFDDERLRGFTGDDFDILRECLIEEFGNRIVYFFDEIQEIDGFEGFLRRLHNMGAKIYLTGSNATLLSQEISTALTGRHLDIILFPFSFREYIRFYEYKQRENNVNKYKLDFNDILISLETTQTRALLTKLFNTYCKEGGFPEFLETHDGEVLMHLYRDILLRDIVVRYKIRKESELLDLSSHLFGNISQRFTYRRLTNLIGLKSSNSIKQYLHYINNTYLGFILSKWDPSVGKQMHSIKKFYAIDTGLVNRITVKIGDDKGWILENLVFIELLRRYHSHQLYYLETTRECDFIIKRERTILMAIQVTTELKENTQKREIEGLKLAMKLFNLSEGWILTSDQEEELETEFGKIHVQPVWKWLFIEKLEI